MITATIRHSTGAAVLQLTPENDDERDAIIALVQLVERVGMIGPRGYDYMERGISFYIQPKPRSD